MIPLYADWLRSQQRRYLLAALNEAHGNQCRAAELAGIHRNRLNRMIKQSNIGRHIIREIRARQPVAITRKTTIPYETHNIYKTSEEPHA